MGMFDYVKFEYGGGVFNEVDRVWQTKDTPTQGLEEYVITHEGMLCLRGEPTNFTGSIEFYDWFDRDAVANRLEKSPGWITCKALFIKGRLTYFELDVVQDRAHRNHFKEALR